MITFTHQAFHKLVSSYRSLVEDTLLTFLWYYALKGISNDWFQFWIPLKSVPFNGWRSNADIKDKEHQRETILFLNCLSHIFICIRHQVRRIHWTFHIFIYLFVFFLVVRLAEVTRRYFYEIKFDWAMLSGSKNNNALSMNICLTCFVNQNMTTVK